MKALLKQLRARLRRPYWQIVALIMLLCAWISAIERARDLWISGAEWTPDVVGWYVWLFVIGGAMFWQCDRIEDRMKASDRAERREARLRARMAQILQGRA